MLFQKGVDGGRIKNKEFRTEDDEKYKKIRF